MLLILHEHRSISMRNRFANCTVAHKLLLGFGLVFLLMISILSIDIFDNLHQEALTQSLVFEHQQESEQAIAQVVKDEHFYAQLTIIVNILLGIFALCIG